MLPRRHTAAVLLATALAACGAQPTPHPTSYGSTSQPLTVCPTGATVPGIDVSGYQGTIDWAQVAGSGVKFAYAKATEGDTIDDAEFQNNWTGMKAAGVLRGAYHFFHPGDDGTTQADWFLAEVGPLGAPGDLPPMLDWEVTDNSTTATSIAVAQAFIAEIKLKTGQNPVIYTSARVWDLLSDPTQFTASPLWVANWTGGLSNCPTIPSQWTTWVIWQWADSGTTPGITTQDPDLDVFNGTLAQLTAWANGTAVTPPAQMTGNQAVTLVNWPDKHLELFARTPAGSEMHTATSGTNDVWSAPAALGTGAACGSAASFWGGTWTYPNLFSPLTSGGAAELSWTTAGGWTPYEPFGTTSLSELSTAVTSDGRSEVFALGSDHTIWANTWSATTSAWSGWASLGGTVTFTTGAGAITWGNGTVELFAVDASGAPWHMWSDSTGSGGWSAWTAFPAGGPLASRPVPVRWADGTDGHAETFARGTDGQLYHSDFSYTTDWPGFTVVSAGSQIIGEPSALMNPGSASAQQGPEVFARDPNGQVVHVAWNGTAYGTFSALGTEIIASDPFGWTRGDGASEVFAVDMSGQLVHTYNDPATGWTAWDAIGSGFDPCVPGAIISEPDAGPSADAGAAETIRGDGGQAPHATPRGCGCSAGEGSPAALLWAFVSLALGRARLRGRGTRLLGGLRPPSAFFGV